ncbi:MAG: T9SS type A sorting domain-containing protein, partial [Saprospiraceae bacterium]|nr:T9SS type A sorting domain-containing protein [Saprospiraceae bacterium]
FSTDAPAEGDFCQTAVAVTPGEYAVEEFTGDAAAAGPTIGTSTLSETPYANSEWYSFTPTTNGTMTITSCNGAASDTRLWVYTGDCATLSGLTVVAESDDDCLGTAGPSQVVDVPVTAGTTYLIEWNDRFSEDAFLWELIFNPLTVDVTFQVDMALQTVAGSGVFLAGSFSDFQNLPMSDGNGDGVYTATVAIPENTTVTYKFKNGTDGWESINTSIGTNCTTGGFGDRFYNTGTADVTLPVVCFAYCVTCNQVVDVEEFTLQNGVKIFPNPANDVLNIRYDFSETVQQFNIRIYNAQGAQVYNRYMGQSLNGTVEIDSRQFPAGAYMVQLMDGASQVTRKVIIE